MDRATVAAALARQGILIPALEDGLRRAEQYFGASEPDEAQVETWVEGLTKDARHLFGRRIQADTDAEEDLARTPAEAVGWPEEVWAAAAPSTRLAAWRELQAEQDEPPTHGRDQRRPQPYTATVAQQAELAALKTVSERLTRFRAMRDEAQGRG